MRQNKPPSHRSTPRIPRASRFQRRSWNILGKNAIDGSIILTSPLPFPHHQGQDAKVKAQTAPMSQYSLPLQFSHMADSTKTSEQKDWKDYKTMRLRVGELAQLVGNKVMDQRYLRVAEQSFALIVLLAFIFVTHLTLIFLAHLALIFLVLRKHWDFR